MTGGDNRDFDRGYLLCLSNLINMYGQGTEAEELMLALGVTRQRIVALNLTDYDREPLLKLRRELDQRARNRAELRRVA